MLPGHSHPMAGPAPDMTVTTPLILTVSFAHSEPSSLPSRKLLPKDNYDSF